MPAPLNTFLVYCPACARGLNLPASLLGKRAKCSCGQSLLLPSTPDGHAQLVSATSSPSLGYHTPSNSPFDAARPALRQVILYSTLLLVLLTGILVIRHFRHSTPAPIAAPAPVLPGEDALVTQMLQDEGGTEAREWLAAHHGRMLAGLTDSQARGRIDQWYKMGATGVYAFGPNLTTHIAIELPAEPAKRKALLDWTNEWNAQSQVKPVRDVGQKYALVRLKL